MNAHQLQAARNDAPSVCIIIWIYCHYNINPPGTEIFEVTLVKLLISLPG